METPLEGRRILIVEDEYLIAHDVAERLTLCGAEVVGPAADIDDALAAIRENVVDAAVLDLNLAGRTDFRVADELLRRNLPFVFATGYDASIIPARLQHVERFEKPYDTAALAEFISGLLASRANALPGAGRPDA